VRTLDRCRDRGGEDEAAEAPIGGHIKRASRFAYLARGDVRPGYHGHRLVTGGTTANTTTSALAEAALGRGKMGFGCHRAALSPSQLLHEAQPGRSYQLTGTVVAHSVQRAGQTLDFRVEDRVGGTVVPVAYTGTVPDPFREGREVIVTVQKGSGQTFVGERDSLITKCPSKYKVAPSSENQSY
jgi:cytochrome c-type biogenesis protein CcmE